MIYKDLSKFSEEELLNIKGRFNLVNFKANQLVFENFQSHLKFLEENKDKAIWDVPWMIEHYHDSESEDGESSEESSEEEDK